MIPETRQLREDAAARKVRVSLTLTPDLIDYLDELASTDADLNRSLVVRKIVADHQRAFAAGRSAASAVSPLLRLNAG